LVNTVKRSVILRVKTRLENTCNSKNTPCPWTHFIFCHSHQCRLHCHYRLSLQLVLSHLVHPAHLYAYHDIQPLDWRWYGDHNVLWYRISNDSFSFYCNIHKLDSIVFVCNKYGFGSLPMHTWSTFCLHNQRNNTSCSLHKITNRHIHSFALCSSRRYETGYFQEGFAANSRLNVEPVIVSWKSASIHAHEWTDRNAPNIESISEAVRCSIAANK